MSLHFKNIDSGGLNTIYFENVEGIRKYWLEFDRSIVLFFANSFTERRDSKLNLMSMIMIEFSIGIISILS